MCHFFSMMRLKVAHKGRLSEKLHHNLKQLNLALKNTFLWGIRAKKIER